MLVQASFPRLGAFKVVYIVKVEVCTEFVRGLDIAHVPWIKSSRVSVEGSINLARLLPVEFDIHRRQVAVLVRPFWVGFDSVARQRFDCCLPLFGSLEILVVCHAFKLSKLVQFLRFCKRQPFVHACAKH